MSAALADRIRALTPTGDYVADCRHGRKLAVEYMAWLADNPEMIGSNLLGLLATCFDPNEELNGIRVGFFSHLERFIGAAAQSYDLRADLDQYEARTARILAARTAERDMRKAANGIAEAADA